MKIAYANTYYRKNHTGGGHVHMEQFVSNAVALGHQIWTWPNNEYPNAKIVPTSFFSFVRTMRQIDVLYVRLERKPSNICKWTLPPYRLVYGFPLVVWEFNTIPEEGLSRGQTEDDVESYIQYFKHYGRGCDLAVCVSRAAAEYVQKKLGIRRVMIVPNGSDPTLFHPDAPIIRRMSPFQDQFNVVWIGSAGIEYHDFEILRKAAQLLWDHRDDKSINFHIIGGGLSGKMGDMPPNVYYWGSESYRKLPEWLSAMDVGLYVTRGGASSYGTPLKVFDYMASGLTLVGTEHFFLNELFDELGQKDFLVPLGDYEALGRVILDLAKNRDLVNRQGQAGRQLVVDHYNWRRAVADTMDEIEKIIKAKQNR